MEMSLSFQARSQQWMWKRFVGQVRASNRPRAVHTTFCCPLWEAMFGRLPTGLELIVISDDGMTILTVV